MGVNDRRLPSFVLKYPLSFKEPGAVCPAYICDKVKEYIMDERSVKEIIREELQKLKELTWGQRLGYIWDYYKPLMVAILAIAALISIGVTIYRNKQIDHLLNVYMVNCNPISTDGEALAQDFGEYLGGLDKNQMVTFDTSISLGEDTSQYGMAGQMKLTTLTAAGEIDILLLDPESYQKYSAIDYFADLTTLLSEEQLAAWSDLLVGADGEPADGGAVYAVDLTDSPVLVSTEAYSGPVYGCVLAKQEYSKLCDDLFAYLLAS